MRPAEAGLTPLARAQKLYRGRFWSAESRSCSTVGRTNFFGGRRDSDDLSSNTDRNITKLQKDVDHVFKELSPK
jgi:hypothetical protein